MAAASAAYANDFEIHVRPVLAKHCYACHGPGAAPAEPRLDRKPDATPSALQSVIQQREGASHPALDIPAADREVLRAWIAGGAPWPETAKRYSRGTMAEYVESARQEHWSFLPVAAQPPPSVANPSWVQSPVDAFILARLERADLQPSPRADKRTLIRRAYHDLTGLPPSLDAISEFEADTSSGAFTRVVDGLLASPHFGERWGRYWLDVARYSDTKGSSFREDRLFPFSHTYRDYVIRALNEDLPYDAFIRHQLAADQLNLGDDKRPLAALGFLTLGKSFGANIHDRIDDRIDVVTRGLQGLTVNCARCHDHKFDPIPTADYYSLYGVFRSTREPEELPLIEKPDEGDPAYQEYLAGLSKVEAARDAHLDRVHVALLSHARENIQSYLDAVAKGWSDESQLERLAEENSLRLPLLKRWRNYLQTIAADGDSSVFGFWLACMQLESSEFTSRAESLLAEWERNRDSGPPVNRWVRDAFRDVTPDSMASVNAVYGKLLREVDREWLAMVAARLQRVAHGSDAGSLLPDALPDADREALRQVLYGPDAPVNVPHAEVRAFCAPEDRTRIAQRQQAVELFKNSHPGRPNRAMALEDAPALFDPYVFTRGDATSEGEKVPRQYLAVLSSGKREPFRHGSGRLELAEIIASEDNPLTARVFVNRVWAQLFDRPIVGTPSDFGTQGQPPTHPALLDFLAWRFMEDGWSVKKLIRGIMLSATYQQSTNVHPDGFAGDPENSLLWRQNRRRLDFETMRDNLLAAADNIDLSMGGFPESIVDPPFGNRRTIYAEVDRHALPTMFRVFDFASPDEHTPMRFETTVPQQALYMMNSPFVAEQARSIVARDSVAGAGSGAARVEEIYRAVLKREPTDKERAMGLLFVQGQDMAERRQPAPRDTTWRYGYGVVDEEAGRVASFTEFPHWTGEAFQQSGDMPDETLGHAMLDRLGGRPGGPGQAVIRRWTSRADSLVSCVGELFHHSSSGDGIRAYIISSRLGILWQGDVQDGVVATVFDDSEIQVGDTIDLVVACRANAEDDAFRWHPRLYLSGDNAAEFEKQDWITRFDFEGPPPAPPVPLKPWEQYAQVLLMSNEFMFVD